MADRILSEDELRKFYKLIDEGDIETLKMFRDEAEKAYDFSGFDHCNLYNRLNYLNGTLHALEATRRDMSIKSAERLIEILYVLGYAYKRIVFVLYEFGYLDFHYRDVMNYIHQKKRSLDIKREKFMAELDSAANDIFQTMKKEVMRAERDNLEIYLAKIEKIQIALRDIDPVEESTKFRRLSAILDNLTETVKKMHGVEAIRDASIEIKKDIAKAEANRMLAQGFKDEMLKDRAQQESGVREIGPSKNQDALLID